MISSLSSLASLVKTRKQCIDGQVFRCHYQLTVILLVTFCVIISSKILVGEPIDCEINDKTVSKSFINTYCFVNSTYSIDPEFIVNFYQSADNNNNNNNNRLQRHGLGHYGSDHKLIYHYYYQWVWLMLFIQAICFYFPHWLWKCFEANKISSLVTDLNYFSSDSQVIDKKVDLIVDYLYKINGINDWYALKYYFCEVLSLINVIIQIVANDIFLSHQFNDYGFRLFRYLTSDPTVKVDPMSKIFPILSKCELNRFGSTGSVERLDTLCLLSVNIFNQKIYLFLWFWYYFLVIVTSFVFAFRLLLICCPQIRYYVYRYRLTESRLTASEYQTKRLISRLKLDDWFKLLLLSKNIESILFARIIDKLCEKFYIDDELNGKINDEVSYL
ncbi:innexin inx2-like [Oppia nitens]|uniref:innexin inx2-like n=1 Tax=Oppia nitens TaxID=1686743 RepID=UPI0023D9A729|nr:innexin inx2-like [Oppia nitens]